jgi:hypothetical protein
MRQFLYALGVLFAVGIGAAGIGLVWRARTEPDLQLESKTYVEAAVVAISGDWSEEELRRRASPQLAQDLTLKPRELDMLFYAASAGLGRLTHYQGAAGEARTMATTTRAGTVASAEYIVTAQYEKGSAELTIELLKVGGAWKIDGFSVDSSAMMSNLARLARRESR